MSDSGKEKNSGRSTLVKQRPTVFPDLDNDTPRIMLKRIIRTRKYLFFQENREWKDNVLVELRTGGVLL